VLARYLAAKRKRAYVRAVHADNVRRYGAIFRPSTARLINRTSLRMPRPQPSRATIDNCRYRHSICLSARRIGLIVFDF